VSADGASTMRMLNGSGRPGAAQSAVRPSNEPGWPRSAPRDRNFIEPLARGLAILQAFTPQDRWLGNLEVAARVNLPNATVNRLLKSLARLGYLSFSPQLRQYQLAAPVLSLGYAAVANSTVRQLLRWHMQALADDANAFLMLGQRDRLDIVLLEICHSNSSLVTLRLEQGARLPIAETAMGWALMAAVPEEEREYLLTHIKRKYEDQWPLIEHKIRRAFAQIKRSGYCVSLGAWRSEVTTAAVALVPVDRSSALVLGCAGAGPYMPINRITREIGPTLVSLAKRMSEELPNGDA
jgi:DNA-binding IclR family transcriptional regulator